MISLLFLDPTKVAHGHPVAIEIEPRHMEVDLSIFVDLPDGVDQLGARDGDLVANFGNTSHGDSVTGPCSTCGQSALGTATNGQLYCHRLTCCDWKAERWKAIEMRRKPNG